MQLYKTSLVGLMAITLLIGCSTKKSFILTPPKVYNQFIPSIIWKCSIGNGNGKYYSQLSPAYDNFIVYAADRKGMVKAIDFNSGKILWSIDLSKHVNNFSTNLSVLLSGGITVAENNLYIGTETGKVIALNKINGEIAWTTDVAGEALSQPVISHNLVLIHTNNGILQALDANNGENKWSINLDASALSIRGKSAPAITYGVAIVGSNGGRISAVMLPHGEIIWQQYISKNYGTTEIDRLHDINITPAIDMNSGIIFAIAYNGDLVAMDISSGQIIWKRDFGSVNDIIINNDSIYLVDQNDLIVAIRKSDGITLWSQYALLHHNLTAPILYNGYLVVGDGEGYLHWLNINNGQFLAQNKVDSSGFHSSPVIAHDKLIIQAKNGNVYLIKN